MSYFNFNTPSFSMPSIPNPIYGLIPTIFGHSLAGKALTGLGGAAAILPTMMSTIMLSEIIFRGILKGLEYMSFNPSKEHFLHKANEWLEQSGARPYRGTDLNVLAHQCVAFAAIGIVSADLMRVLHGDIPPVYNTLLAFGGRIRYADHSYLPGILKACGFY